MKLLLGIALGGALGSLCRYGLSSFVQKSAGSGFPIGILSVNILGGFLMGVIVGLGAHRFHFEPHVSAFLTVGILGGFTTFSAFSLDTALMIEKHQYLMASLYVMASVCLSVGALFAGLKLARLGLA